MSEIPHLHLEKVSQAWRGTHHQVPHKGSVVASSALLEGSDSNFLQK